MVLCNIEPVYRNWDIIKYLITQPGRGVSGYFDSTGLFNIRKLRYLFSVSLKVKLNKHLKCAFMFVDSLFISTVAANIWSKLCFCWVLDCTCVSTFRTFSLHWEVFPKDTSLRMPFVSSAYCGILMSWLFTRLFLLVCSLHANISAASIHKWGERGSSCYTLSSLKFDDTPLFITLLDILIYEALTQSWHILATKEVR